MKRRDIPFVAFGLFVSVSAGYTSAMIVMHLAPLLGLDGPWAGGIVGSLVFAGTVLFLDRLESN